MNATTPHATPRTPGPFAHAARRYLELGYVPIPVGGDDGKVLLVKGHTGRKGIDPTPDRIAEWIEGYDYVDSTGQHRSACFADANIALRLPPNVIGLDVDNYDGKLGAATLMQWTSDLGELPPTLRSTSRLDGISGIRLYRVEPGQHWRGDLGTGSGVEVIQHAHRYIVVGPSVHRETGRTYRWYDWNDEVVLASSADFLEADDLPELPWAWQERLRTEIVEFDDPAPYTGPIPAELTYDANHIRRRALRRLDECREAATAGGKGYTGPEWDKSTFVVACHLRELANSPWAGYSQEQALADLLARAPRDAGWNEADIREKWRVACERVGGRGKAWPGSEDPFDVDTYALPPHPDEHEEGEESGTGETDPFASADTQARPVVEAQGSPGAEDAAVGEVRAEEEREADAEVIEEELGEHGSRVKRSTIPHGKPGWSGQANLAALACREELGGKYIWAEGLGWLRWDGRRWAQCGPARPVEAVRLWVLDLHREAVVNGADASELKLYAKLLTRDNINAVVALAQGILVRQAAEFDAHPDLLNVGNGIVDLRTGQLRRHDSTLLLTKVTPTSYIPGASHPDWDAAQNALPAATLEYMRSRIGQAATGHAVPDDVLVVCVGGGENGKSAVLGVAERVLGEHATYVSDRVLLAENGAHTTELMDLRGVRMALLEETPEARRLNVARLKKVAGTAKIKARLMRQDSTEFVATHSMFVTSNYRPIIEETDHGTWRRLSLVTFPYTFRKPGEELHAESDRHGDPGLKERLIPTDEAHEAPAHAAVLSWIVEGAMAYYAARDAQLNGTAPKGASIMAQAPASVVADTRAWRTESDLILGYLDDRIVWERDRHVMSTELVEDFNEWAQGRGNQEWSTRTFMARFEGHDEVKRHKVATGRKRGSANLVRRAHADAFGGMGRVLPGPTPSQYTAVMGLRFKVEADEMAEPFADAANG